MRPERSIQLMIGFSLLAALAALGATAPEAPEDLPWLGVWLSDAVDGGVRIVHVVEGGPAADAGLLANDLLIGAGGRSVTDREELSRVVDPLRPGQAVPLRVMRGKEALELEIVLGKRRSILWTVPEPPEPSAIPRPVAAPRPARAIGLQVAEVPPALRRHYRAPEDAGVLVMTVGEGTPAERTGILVGDVLVEVGGAKILEARQIMEAVRAWDGREPLQVSVVRAGETAVLPLALREEVVSAGAPAPASARSLVRSYREQRIREKIDALEHELERLRDELAHLESPPD